LIIKINLAGGLCTFKVISENPHNTLGKLALELKEHNNDAITEFKENIKKNNILNGYNGNYLSSLRL
jgi:hypothetical protein